MLVSLIVGISVGSIYGLTSMGLVLTYRTSGVFNLGHGAIGMFGTYCFWQMWQEWGWPMLPALVVALGVISPLLGVVAYYGLFRWIRGRPTTVMLVAGIAMIVAVQGLAEKIWTSVFRVLPSLFPFDTYQVTSDFRVTSEQIGTVVATLILGAVLVWFLQRTRLGLCTRAVVDNRELAEIGGNDADRIQVFSWCIAAAMSTLSGILISPFIQLSPTGLTLIVINAMAAAVFGRLRSLPLTYAGGLALGVTESMLSRYLPGTEVFQGLKISAAAIVLYLAVLVGRRAFAGQRDDTQSDSGSVLGRDFPAAPLTPLLLIFAAIFAFIPLASPYTVFLLGSALTVSVAFQGYVIVGGLGGQALLCQGTFMGVGALSFARMVTDWNWPYIVAGAAATLITLVFGLAVSIPAVRIRGLALALVGLAFGLFADAFLFRTSALAGGYAGFTLSRPSIFGVDLSNETAFAMFAGVAALVAALLVRNLASGRTGRLLTAARNSELATEAFGTSIRQVKLVLFALASWFGGLAGVLVALQIQTVGAVQFNVLLSISFIAVSLLGGIGHAQGAVVGGMLLYLLPEVLQAVGLDGYQQIVFGVGSAVVLFLGRGGLGDLLSRILTLGGPQRLAPQPALQHPTGGVR